ncbi:MAG: multidrug resistance efflux pump [Verrucomicrobiales bacterium]|jgi:multidrug resistance efflux pump
MTAEIPKPAEIRQTKGYLLRRIISKWPFLIWFSMVLVTYSLHKRGVRFERMNGFVVAETQTIAALQDGVIQEMGVTESGQTVAAGAVVVKLDKRMLQAELDKLAQDTEFDRIDQERKFGTLKTDYVNDLAKLKSERDGATAQAAVLQSTLDTLRERAEARTIPMSDYTEQKTEYETLRATLPSYETRIGTLEAAIGKVDSLLEKLKSFNEQEPVDVRSLKDQIATMELKALSGGTVSQVYFSTGAAVKRGEPIVRVINTDTLSARGFIQEGDAAKVSVGMQVFISPTGEAAAAIYPGTITYIAPQITSTPDIGSSVSGRVIKGREITCSFDDKDIKLLPGQSVSIHLEKPGKMKLFDFGGR